MLEFSLAYEIFAKNQEIRGKFSVKFDFENAVKGNYTLPI